MFFLFLSSTSGLHAFPLYFDVAKSHLMTHLDCELVPRNAGHASHLFGRQQRGVFLRYPGDASYQFSTPVRIEIETPPASSLRRPGRLSRLRTLTHQRIVRLL